MEPDPSDSNKSRWQMADYWVNLVGDVGRIKIFTLPGSDYSLEKCRHFVIDMAGNAIDAMLQIYETVDDFVMAVKSRRCAPNPTNITMMPVKLITIRITAVIISLSTIALTNTT